MAVLRVTAPSVWRGCGAPHHLTGAVDARPQVNMRRYHAVSYENRSAVCRNDLPNHGQPLVRSYAKCRSNHTCRHFYIIFYNFSIPMLRYLTSEKCDSRNKRRDCR
ncbi:unnamed protein product [Parnassius mnemosyne]|uniref:Secreted protein n=1 Tax=Parnassius mnemosyne TaxID=213953 RepID=A0AAV1KIY5_9NEOP